jgi:hypothetical protein
LQKLFFLHETHGLGSHRYPDKIISSSLKPWKTLSRSYAHNTNCEIMIYSGRISMMLCSQGLGNWVSPIDENNFSTSIYVNITFTTVNARML